MTDIIEVIAPLAIDAATRLDKRIRLMADTLRDNIAKITGLIEEAKTGEIHVALGFASWTAYLADALGGRLELDSDSRREVVALMSGEGMSQRAIAQAVGVNQATISRDQQVMHDASPAAPMSAFFTDADEEADCMAMADLTDAGFEKVLAAARAEGDLSRHNVMDMVRSAQPVTGLDGKTYPRPNPQPAQAPRRRPITVAFDLQISKVAKSVGSIERLSEDERFDRNLGALGCRRSDLVRARDALNRVLAKFEELDR
jgi:transposase-like protein